jgi:hypothetical protein
VTALEIILLIQLLFLIMFAVFFMDAYERRTTLLKESQLLRLSKLKANLGSQKSE